MSVSFVSKDLGKAKIESELKKARRLVALVGIPSDSEPEKDSDIPLATIAYINEKGSTVNKIPPRPFMRQTRERAERGNFPKFMRKLLKGLSSGSVTAEKAINRLGADYEGRMKDIFIHGSFVENAESTKRRKKSSKPLIDTRHLNQSIKYKVVNL